MDILTIEKKIKSHTIRLDDTEVERYMSDHDAWIDLLSTLLTAKMAPNGHAEAPQKQDRRVKRPRKTNGPSLELIVCPKCGRTVKRRGLLVHQRGSQCRSQTGSTLE